jgi:hypothetical protein
VATIEEVAIASLTKGTTIHAHHFQQQGGSCHLQRVLIVG